MTQDVVACPILERHLADELRLHPLHAPTHFPRHSLDEGLGHAQGLEPPPEIERGVMIEAGPDPARVEQPPIFVAADHQRADTGATFLEVREADDHELLTRLAFRLEPLGGATGAVGAVLLLGNDALEPQLSGLSEHLVAGRVDVIGISDRAQAAAALDELVQHCLAVDQRSATEVIAIEVEEIEGKESKPSLIVGAERLLERSETRMSLVVEHHHLAIEGELLGGKRLERPDQPLEALGPILSRAGQQSSAVRIAPAIDAVAIELELMEPVLAVGWAIDGGRELRRHEFLQRAALRPGDPRQFCGRFLPRDRRLVGGAIADPGAAGALVLIHGLAAECALLDPLCERVSLAGTGELVALLDQEPVVFSSFLAAAAHADESPATL